MLSLSPSFTLFNRDSSECAHANSNSEISYFVYEWTQPLPIALFAFKWITNTYKYSTILFSLLRLHYIANLHWWSLSPCVLTNIFACISYWLNMNLSSAYDLHGFNEEAMVINVVWTACKSNTSYMDMDVVVRLEEQVNYDKFA